MREKAREREKETETLGRTEDEEGPALLADEQQRWTVMKLRMVMRRRRGRSRGRLAWGEDDEPPDEIVDSVRVEQLLHRGQQAVQQSRGGRGRDLDSTARRDLDARQQAWWF